MIQQFELTQLIRPHILTLKPYSSARDEYDGTEGIFLDANENPFGSAGESSYNRYPDPYQKTLKNKIAQIKAITPDKIFVGNGSDEAIDLLIRVFCEPRQHNILIMPPTYGMYEVSANLHAVEVRKANLTPDFEIDTQKVWEKIDHNTRLIFICSPNNPSGNLLDKKAILDIIQKFEGIVVLDEAYVDFTPEPSFLTELAHYPNLVIMQTLSKAWGLAGLRLGLAFAQPEIIYFLNKVKPPYNVSQATQEIALKNLNEARKNEMVNQMIEQRVFLEIELKKIAFVKHIYPSHANFLLVKMQNAHEIYHKLVQKLIIVRDRSNVVLCEDCLRLSVGTPQENTILLEALRSL